MKTILAFVLGAAAAAGIVLFLTRGSEPVPEPAVEVFRDLAPPETPAPPVAEPAPPAQPAPPPPAPAPVKSAAKAKPKVPPPPAARVQLPEPEPAPAPAAAPPAAPTVAATPAPEPPPARAAPAPAPVPASPPRPEPKTVTLAQGTLISVRLLEKVSSETHAAGDTFDATLDQPIVVEGLVIAERGARVYGRLATSEKAGRVQGLSRIALELTELTTADGQKVALSTAAFEKQAEKTTTEDAKKVGIGAALGAAIGAIAGGGKGAAIGAAAGGAAGTGAVVATRGEAAELPVETRLSFRLSRPVTITEKLP